MRAAIYTRISTDPEDTAAGVKRQEKDATAIIEQKGWDLAGVFCDNDVSATDRRKRRPKYDELMRLVDAGEIDAIAVFKIDRLYRRPIELEELIERVEDGRLAGGIHTTADGELNLNTVNGRALARVAVTMAKAEVENTQERLEAMNRHAAVAGKRVGGRRAFGYEQDGMTERPAEAVEYRRLVEAVLNGASLRSLAADLNERGVTTAGGSAWSTARIRDVLSNPRYCGLRTYRGEVVSDAVWDGLVDRETWELLQAILRDPARRTSPGNGRRHLLSGFVVCGICDARLASRTNHGRPAYGCRAKRDGGCGGVVIDAATVDENVRVKLFEVLTDPRIADHVASAEDDSSTDVAGQIATLEDRLDAAAVSYAGGRLERRQLEAITSQLTTEIDALRRRIVATTRRGPKVDVLADAEAIWETSLEDRRELVRAAIDRITVSPADRPGVHADSASRVGITWRV